MTKKYLYTKDSGGKEIKKKFEVLCGVNPWSFVDSFDPDGNGELYVAVPRQQVQLHGFVSVTNLDEQARLAPLQMVIEIQPNP
ncbi:MAG: hypothetical protein WCG28_00815 [bacterium]